ncbi:MAG: VOC family protein [Clostridia bacterium]
MKMVHVTIHSACLEESVAFYREVVGLVLQRDLRPAGAPIVFLADGEGKLR